MRSFDRISNRESRKESTGGFTVVELIVVVAIIGILLVIVFFDRGSANQSIALSNDAYMLAGAIREAQVTGLSVREAQVGKFDDRFERGYGVYFERGKSSVVHFVDLDQSSNNKYNLGSFNCVSDNECVKVVTMEVGTVTGICELDSNSERCSSSSASYNRASVAFKRPDTDAIMVFNNREIPDTYGVRIDIESPQGESRSILIGKTGFVSVQ